MLGMIMEWRNRRSEVAWRRGPGTAQVRGAERRYAHIHNCGAGDVVLLSGGRAPPRATAQHEQHAAPANATDPGPVPKYVADPIPLYTTGLGPFTARSLRRNREAQAFFDQGFQMMYAFAKLDAVRSFREAWKRDPDCAICFWGEAWAWGSYLNGPMSAEQSPFAYAAAQKGPGAARQGDCRRSARSSTRSSRVTSRISRSRSASSRTRHTPRRCGSSPRSIPMISISARSTLTRCSCSNRGAGRATSTRRTSSACTACSRACSRANPKHPGACHLYVHATESTVRPDKAEACASFLGSTHPGREPHQSHALAHLQRGRPLGRFGARQPAGLAFGSEGRIRRRLRHLSRPQPAHAALRGVDGRPGRHCHPGGPRLRASEPTTRCTRCSR